MSNKNPNSDNASWIEILGGIILVLFTNFLASILGMYVFATIAENSKFFGSLGYNVYFLGLSSVWIYQLLYIIPVIIFSKRQRNFALIKGVIIGAVITALIAGFCFVQIVSFLISAK